MTKKETIPNNIRRMPQNNTNNSILLYIIFVFLLLYSVIVLISYFSQTHMTRYEVVEGSLASNTIYRGIILRDEECITVQDAGYVNYLAREGQRVSVGDLVYTVDETGSLNDYLESQSLGENMLTEKEMDDLKTQIVDFAHTYDATNYDDVYSFKYSLKNAVVKLANTKLLEGISTASENNPVQYCYSIKSGIIDYWIDGYETLDPAEITKSSFDEKEYQRENLLSNSLHSNGDTIYKLSKSEDWSIVIPVTEAFGEQLLEEQYVKVRFLKNQDESWGKVSLLNNADGFYVQLSFTNSMITFVSDRYLDIELVLSEDKGLKIPISAIAEKEFFLIDDSFIIEDDDSNYSVIMQTYDENGQKSASKIYLDVYSYDSQTSVYYVDNTKLSAGDILYKEDGQDTFIVKNRGSLIGVYNINRGYADFKQITILYQNDEYAIVKSNTKYGLRVYDYIALNAKTVNDDQFITK